MKRKSVSEARVACKQKRPKLSRKIVDTIYSVHDFRAVPVAMAEGFSSFEAATSGTER